VGLHAYRQIVADASGRCDMTTMMLGLQHACKVMTALTWLRMQLRYVQGL